MSAWSGRTRPRSMRSRLTSRRSARPLRMLRKRRLKSLAGAARTAAASRRRDCLTAAAATCYAYTLLNFWSSPALGIHLPVPYPAYLLIALSLILGVAALRTALGLWSPHAKLAIAGIALSGCVTFGVGGGRFVSYTLRGTLNPPFKLKLEVNDRFPDFRLIDQNGQIHDGDLFSASPQTLVVIYRGDF